MGTRERPSDAPGHRNRDRGALPAVAVNLLDFFKCLRDWLFAIRFVTFTRSGKSIRIVRYEGTHGYLKFGEVAEWSKAPVC